MAKKMKTGMRGQEILKEALEAFEKITGLTVEIYPLIKPEGPGTAINIKMNGAALNFVVEIKETFTPAMIGAVLQQGRKDKEKRIIITRYIPPQIADKLKAVNVPFVDTAGNAYIKEPAFYIFIKGNRPVERPNKKLQTRAFRPTGLQVIYALLCNPTLEEANYRTIARVADVALGTVGWVMQDLKKMGYLIDMGSRGRRLIQKEKLLIRWVTAYPEELRPKKLIGRYVAADPDFWKHKNLPLHKAYWGGEVAAAKLNQYLKPEMVTIYTTGQIDLAKYMIENRLKPDPGGKIEILKIFWDQKQETRHPEVVHPILVYADLQATGDPRNIETAEMIYEQELTQFIRED